MNKSIKFNIEDFQKFTLGNDPWSETLKRETRKTPHYQLLRELEIDPNIKMEDTSYHQWLMKGLKRNGSVWGLLYNKNDIDKQYNRYVELIKNPELGESNKTTLIGKESKNGMLYYGPYPTIIKADGTFRLTDGRHRIAIKLFNNNSIELTICERDVIWSKLINDLKALYVDKKLHQPFDHFDFKDCESNRDNEVEKKLDQIFTDFNVKNVLDLGICHGYTVYKLKHHLNWAIGVEYNKTRYQISKALFDQLGFTTHNMNIVDFMEKYNTRTDCILSIAVLHHILRQKPINKVNSFLEKISKFTKMFIYTLPEPGEPQYLWIPEHIRKNIHNYIFEKIAFPYRKCIKLRSRKLVVLHK